MTEIDIRTAREHHPRLVRSRDVRAQIHGAGTLGPFNTWLAVRVTHGVGSMWAAYVFAALALISLPAAIATGQTLVIVAWTAQTFLQLVLLPIIMVGQRVLQAASDARAEADHETLSAVHRLTIAVHEIDEAQTEILKELRARGAPAASRSPTA